MKRFLDVHLLLWFMALFCSSQGLRCYTCSMVSDSTDDLCLKDPANVVTGTPITDCKMKYCTIVRMEYNNENGKIYSFMRGCQDDAPSADVTDASHTTYQRRCTTELCNSWDGIAEGSGSGDAVGDGIWTVVTGVDRSGATRLPAATSASCIAVFVVAAVFNVRFRRH